MEKEKFVLWKYLLVITIALVVIFAFASITKPTQEERIRQLDIQKTQLSEDVDKLVEIYRAQTQQAK